MEEFRWYRLIGKYVYQYRRIAAAFILFVVIYAAVFSLYDLEVEAVLYATGLCVLAAAVMLTVGFVQYCRQRRSRLWLSRNIELEFDKLPEAGNLVEQDYQELLRALGQINAAHLTDWQKASQESIDYYTTWIHQIKTPIAVMRMTLQGEDTEEHRELLAQLFRIEQYVEMVLSYIRLGSSQTDFVFEECNLDNIIRQAIHKYAPLFVRSRIGLVYEPTEIKVLTDEKWLLFLLEQLLSNAVKYTREGKVTIAVSSDEILSVADTGIGIASEDLPRIFDKGFTGYHGREDKKATGLGLYLCKQTADKLGIDIKVHSEVGKGTSFFLNLHKERA
ncbi:MAG: sensor histidine kinase [Lachnospiraceae bacterium]|nr:sensor histidine kinase [Lachnospiraceae bacterium]